MTDTTKISKSYSLDPTVIRWVARRAAQLTLQGERSNDSRVVNDILTAYMLAVRKRGGRKRLESETEAVKS